MNFKLFAGLAFGIVAFTLFLLWANTAKADIVEDVLGCKDDPCIVTYSPGGILGKFEEAAEAIQKGARKLVVINGACKSACTILIDRIPDQVCLTVWAQLYFHRGTRPTIVWVTVPMLNFELQAPMLLGKIELFTPDYSPLVIRWIDNVGGLPKDGSFVVMPAEIARVIWPSCKPPTTPEFFQAHGLY